MGGQPSRAKKLTIDNEDGSNVIKVSDDVVDRIKGSASEGPKVRGTQTQNPESVKVPESTHLCPSSLTALKLQQQHEVDIKKNDAYWQERVKNLEINHRKMREVMEVEFKKAVDESGVEKKKKKLKISPPCLDRKLAVMACYKMHPTEPMLCAKEVQDFTDCVDMKRAAFVKN